MEYTLIFLVLVMGIAFLYSSVGHGGASGYLALMAVFSFTPTEMKVIALQLNILIALVSFFVFFKKVEMPWKLFFSFTICSLPFAFLGGLMNVDGRVYKFLLSLILIFSLIRIFYNYRQNDRLLVPLNYYYAALIGAVIGFISGIIGIGGGVLLSPLLLILGWSNFKQTSLISALFIVVNSIAGLLGVILSGKTVMSKSILLPALFCLVGGFLGAYSGAFKFTFNWARLSLAAVLLIAILKLLIV